MKKLLIPIWIKILPHINNNWAYKVSKLSCVTYSHTCKNITVLMDMGMLVRRKVGRRWILTLTHKGEEASLLCYQLLNMIKK